MSKILATGNDKLVEEWAFVNFGIVPLGCNLAVGIMDGPQIVAAAFFHAHNGPDVEISYYGPRTMTLDVVKGLARIAVEHLGVSRVTARTASTPDHKRIRRGFAKIGFEYEGTRRCGYGSKDAIMFGLYGRKFARLTGKVMQ